MHDPNQFPTFPAWSRREFGRGLTGAAAVAVLGLPVVASRGEAADATLLGQLRRSLSNDPARALVFPFDDPRRTMVQNHWAVVPESIASLTLDQQNLALGLIRQVCTPEGFARLTRARAEDSGGWKHDHLAIFGRPDDPDRCEWVLSGRHLTLRGTPTGAITRGPLFLGQAATQAPPLWPGLPELIAALWRSLTAAERDQAAVTAGPGEGWRPGLALGEVGSNPRAIARELLACLVAPFRAFEVPAVRSCLVSEVGLASVVWQGFGTLDSSSGDAPPAWRLAGPGFRWSFHGEPHAHVWFDSV